MPTVAAVISGSPSLAAATMQAVRSSAIPYLVLGADAESLNSICAVRTEDSLLFLAAGVLPDEANTVAHWVEVMTVTRAGAVVDYDESMGRITALLTPRDLFDTLGGFDSIRHGGTGYMEDYLVRLIGLGHDCVTTEQRWRSLPQHHRQAA